MTPFFRSDFLERPHGCRQISHGPLSSVESFWLAAISGNKEGAQGSAIPCFEGQSVNKDIAAALMLASRPHFCILSGEISGT